MHLHEKNQVTNVTRGCLEMATSFIVFLKRAECIAELDCVLITMNCAVLLYALFVSIRFIYTKLYPSLRVFLICNNTIVKSGYHCLCCLYENKLCTRPFSDNIPPDDLCPLLSFGCKCTYFFKMMA